MTFTWPPLEPPREQQQSSLRQLRILWRAYRLRGSEHEFITAALYAHPYGQELRVFLRDEDNLLHSQVGTDSLDPLLEKAENLRQVLLERGWTEVRVLEQPTAPSSLGGVDPP